jgi:hypothetical protein
VRINEIINSVKWWRGRVRVSGITATTHIEADSRSEALALLRAAYGKSSVVSCEAVPALTEKAYGASNGKQVMDRRPYSSPELQVREKEQKARVARASGDWKSNSVAKAEVALKRAQIARDRANQVYTDRSHKVTLARLG